MLFLQLQYDQLRPILTKNLAKFCPCCELKRTLFPATIVFLQVTLADRYQTVSFGQVRST